MYTTAPEGTGLSYENRPNRVPGTASITTAKERPDPPPGADAHSRLVAACHDVVEQRVRPITTEMEASERAKFAPRTVRV